MEHESLPSKRLAGQTAYLSSFVFVVTTEMGKLLQKKDKTGLRTNTTRKQIEAVCDKQPCFQGGDKSHSRPQVTEMS